MASIPCRTAACLTTLLLALAPPAALAGHVEGDYDPCAEGGTPIWLGIPQCRQRETDACASYNRYERKDDAGVCATGPAAGCLAYGLYATVQYGVVATQNAKSQLSLRGITDAEASANQQRVDVAPPLASEATLSSRCVATERSCDILGQVEAVDVTLLGGLVQVEALEARAGLDCGGKVTQETRFARLVVAGTDYGPLVHAGTRINIPGVATVTVGVEPTPSWGPDGMRVSATALRVDLQDPLSGATTGVLLVGHASVVWNA